MFGFSMIKMVRSNAHKLDRTLREKLLKLYKPFRWTPCIFHKVFEGFLKKTRKVPIIIQFQDKDCHQEGMQSVQKIVNKHFRASLDKEFSRISCCKATLTPNALDEVLSHCQHVKKVYYDRKVKALLNHAVPASKADQVMVGNQKLTGKGATIAIIDTGIHPHTALNGRIDQFKDFVNDRTDPYDDNGHGTHCAGDAASAGSPYDGPAPDASLIGVKVLDKVGSGSLSQVIDGVDWCIDHNESNENKIDIISLSLGSDPQEYSSENEDPMVQIVEEAWNSGIVVCVAAGNSGPDPQTIASPGISDRVITVGAYDDKDTDQRSDDEVANFSSRGPTIYREHKPDILAPGVDIISLRAPNSYLDKTQKQNRVDQDYFVLSGTSMATPICAGVVALLIEAARQSGNGWTPDQIKNAIREGADRPANRDLDVYGKGYLNTENALGRLLS